MTSSRTEIPEGSTYLDRAKVEAEQEMRTGGRFKNEIAARVTGVPTYPPQPADSPYHHDFVPAELPLGMDINSLEPVGTHAEVTKSIKPEVAKDKNELATKNTLSDPTPTEPPLAIDHMGDGFE